jgi:hypothetical protein
VASRLEHYISEFIRLNNEIILKAKSDSAHDGSAYKQVCVRMVVRATEFELPFDYGFTYTRVSP